jgi:hypothetical protein
MQDQTQDLPAWRAGDHAAFDRGGQELGEYLQERPGALTVDGVAGDTWCRRHLRGLDAMG